MRTGIRLADAGSDDVDMGGGGVGGSAISGAPDRSWVPLAVPVLPSPWY